MSKKFIVPYYFEMYGTIEVEAEDIEEAAYMVEDGPLPESGSYVEDSFHVDHDVIASYNDEGSEE